MVESEAKELSEDVMLEAVTFGQNSYKDVLRLIIDLAKQAAKSPWQLEKISTKQADDIIKLNV